MDMEILVENYQKFIVALAIDPKDLTILDLINLLHDLKNDPEITEENFPPTNYMIFNLEEMLDQALEIKGWDFDVDYFMSIMDTPLYSLCLEEEVQNAQAS